MGAYASQKNKPGNAYVPFVKVVDMDSEATNSNVTHTQTAPSVVVHIQPAAENLPAAAAMEVTVQGDAQAIDGGAVLVLPVGHGTKNPELPQKAPSDPDRPCSRESDQSKGSHGSRKDQRHSEQSHTSTKSLPPLSAQDPKARRASLGSQSSLHDVQARPVIPKSKSSKKKGLIGLRTMKSVKTFLSKMEDNKATRSPVQALRKVSIMVKLGLGTKSKVAASEEQRTSQELKHMALLDKFFGAAWKGDVLQASLTLEALIASGVEDAINSTDAKKSNWTALHKASRKGHDEMVRFLLAAGADVMARSHAASGGGGRTPLHVSACFEGDNKEVVHLLLNHAPNVDEMLEAEDCDGQTCLDIAFERGKQEIVREIAMFVRSPHVLLTVAQRSPAVATEVVAGWIHSECWKYLRFTVLSTRSYEAEVGQVHVKDLHFFCCQQEVEVKDITSLPCDGKSIVIELKGWSKIDRMEITTAEGDAHLDPKCWKLEGSSDVGDHRAWVELIQINSNLPRERGTPVFGFAVPFKMSQRTNRSIKAKRASITGYDRAISDYAPLYGNPGDLKLFAGLIHAAPRAAQMLIDDLLWVRPEIEDKGAYDLPQRATLRGWDGLDFFTNQRTTCQPTREWKIKRGQDGEKVKLDTWVGEDWHASLAPPDVGRGGSVDIRIVGIQGLVSPILLAELACISHQNFGIFESKVFQGILLQSWLAVKPCYIANIVLECFRVVSLIMWTLVICGIAPCRVYITGTDKSLNVVAICWACVTTVVLENMFNWTNHLYRLKFNLRKGLQEVHFLGLLYWGTKIIIAWALLLKSYDTWLDYPRSSTHLTVNNAGWDAIDYQPMFAMVAVTSWIRVLNLLRNFERFSAIGRILRTLTKVRPMLLILLFLVLTIGHAFVILETQNPERWMRLNQGDPKHLDEMPVQLDDHSIWGSADLEVIMDVILRSFRMMVLSDFNVLPQYAEDGTDAIISLQQPASRMLQYLFFVPSFFIALCLLNILIAVLSDGYTNEQESAMATFLRIRSHISLEFFLRPSGTIWLPLHQKIGRGGAFFAVLLCSCAYVTMIAVGISDKSGGAIPLSIMLFVANQMLQVSLKATPTDKDYLWIASSPDDHDYDGEQGLSSSRRGDRRLEKRMEKLEEHVEEMHEIVRKSHAMIRAQCEKESDVQLQLRQIQAVLHGDNRSAVASSQSMTPSVVKQSFHKVTTED